MHKHVEINKCLEQLEHDDLTEGEKFRLQRRLMQLIALAWHTNEIRAARPTPIDEAQSLKIAFGQQCQISAVNSISN